MGVAVVQAACREDVTGEWVAWAGAAPHVKHPGHARDFGRVETQRLVERRRRLPSPKGGMLRGRHASWVAGGARPGVRKRACGVHPGGGLGRRGAAPQTSGTCL